MANTVDIVEVSPRDGLQADVSSLSTAEKVDLIVRLATSGLRHIEVASFANPKRVPSMADSAEVLSELNRPGVLNNRHQISLIALVFNEAGLHAAAAAGADVVNFVIACSDSFAWKNQRATTKQGIATWHGVAKAASEIGIPATVTLATAFGCPFEGEVPVERVVTVAAQVMQTPPSQLALADTIGAAVPTDVRERFRAIAGVVGAAPLRAHFHNTRNTGLANVAAAVDMGITTIDASLGGIGGCPFAPNATGNVPTEDVAYLLGRMGYATSLDLDELCDTATWLAHTLQHAIPGLLSKTVIFPRHEPLPGDVTAHWLASK